MDLRYKSLNDRKLKQTYKILEESGRVLTFSFIIEKLLKRKLLEDFPAEKSRFWTHLTIRGEVFSTVSSFSKAAVGLKKWVPLKKQPVRKRRFVGTLPLLPEDKPFKKDKKADKNVLRFKHKLSKEEIEEFYLILPTELLRLFSFSGEGFQLTVYCYGDYSFNAWVNSESSTLHSPEIKKYFLENKLKAGDIIYTEKRKDDPTGIHLYTTWQIEELASEKYSPGVKKKLVIVRPERTDKRKSGKEDDYDLVYLLSLIQKKDLVYQFLKHHGPSTVTEIAKAISKELGVKKTVIEKLSFVDLSDRRLVRLPNGKIGIRVLEEDETETTKQKRPKKGVNFFVFVIIVAIIAFLVVLIFALLSKLNLW